MKEYKKTQYGFSVVEYYPDNKLYSVRNNQKESVHYLVPEEIWDSLASAVERADNYRKSRDHFRQSRDQEKEKAMEAFDKINETHFRLVSDINTENQFLMDELNQLERSNNFYKTLLWFTSLFGILSLSIHYLV